MILIRVLTILLVFTGVVKCIDECIDEDFSPCTCILFTVEENIIVVECEGISSEEIKQVFERNTTSKIIRLFLTLTDTAATLPANLMGENIVREIGLTCLNRDFNLQIDPDAFANSASTVVGFYVNGCSLPQLEFTFLTNFNHLTDIEIENSTFPVMKDLPTLPALKILGISECDNYVEWGLPDLSSLIELKLISDMLSDQAVDDILNSILLSYNNSLSILSLVNNSLTRVPDAVHLLPHLTSLNMNENTLSVLPAGSLVFSSGREMDFLGFDDLSLEKIEPGALQGNFRSARILLDFNLLTEFDEIIYRGILEDMANNTGFLQVYFNPFNCDCSLAWLIKDNPHLLEKLDGATCSNGTQFKYLLPEGFDDCDQFISSTEETTVTTSTSTPSSSSSTSVTSTTSMPSSTITDSITDAAIHGLFFKSIFVQSITPFIAVCLNKMRTVYV